MKKTILEQWFATGVPREFEKHAMPDYLLKSTDLFPWDCHIKNDNSQHISRPVRMNQNYTCFFFSSNQQKVHFGVSCRRLLVYVWHEMKKAENRCLRGKQKKKVYDLSALWLHEQWYASTPPESSLTSPFPPLSRSLYSQFPTVLYHLPSY